MNSQIQKKSLADEVADRLRQQLSLGHYRVDEQLPIEPELMKSFGVGRSTIREAIKLLVNSGLLRVQQGVGTFVEQTSSDREPMDQRLKRADKTDLDEVRQLLEMKVAEKAAVNRTKKDISRIKEHLANRKKSADENLVEACIDADIQFHNAIAEASKNDILADLYKTASRHLKNWFLQHYSDTKTFRDSQKMHEQLLEHIIAQNAKEALNTASKIIIHSPK